MKKIILGALLIGCGLMVPQVQAAFMSDVTVLDKKEITKLSDADLTDAYIDTLVEIEATRTFHATSGFSAKEFKDFKNLLKFRILLSMEIHSRNLETPQVESR